MGKIGIAVWSLTAGFAVKCASTYVLTAILKLEGAAIGSVLGFITVAAISFGAVKGLTKIRFDFTLSVIKPVVAGLIMTAVVLVSFNVMSLLISGRLATVFSICAGAGIYGVALIKIKAIAEEEIKMLPKGAKLMKLLKKVRLM